MTKCKECRFWSGSKDHWLPQTATCSRIHSGGGKRSEETARIFPVTSGAYLETDQEFGCAMGRKVGKP